MLVKDTLEEALNAIFAQPNDAQAAAAALATAIDAYIKTATVTVSTPAGPGTGGLS